MKIKISTSGGGKPFMRQLPSLKPTWKDCEFFINEDIKECDYWFVYGGISKEEKAICPKDSVVFITNEPSSVKKYSRNFTNQFGAIITCQDNIRHKNKILSQQALPWWVGHKLYKDGRDNYTYEKTYDELKSISTLNKDKLISIIVSDKSFTKGHRSRVKFVKKLTRELGEDMDRFGKGYNEIVDKWDAIAPYKYTIVIENSSYNNYWTEKLADAFLGQSYPVYYGCKNIYDYFPEDSLSLIDIRKSDKAIKKIREIIDNNLYEKSLDNIKKSKDLILDKYQLFPMIYKYTQKYKNKGGKILITLYPEKEPAFRILKKFLKL